MPFIKRANLKHPLCWLLEASADKMEGLSSSVTSSLDTSHARKASSSEKLSHCNVKRSDKEGEHLLFAAFIREKRQKRNDGLRLPR